MHKTMNKLKSSPITTTIAWLTMDENTTTTTSTNTNRRDDATIKAILSRISNDDKLVEEVRQLLAENLQLRGNNNDNNNNNNNTATVANINDNNVSVTPPPQASADSSSVASDVDKRKISSSSYGNKTRTEEELAFTIDKNSETYQNILSMTKWYRDSFFISSDYADEKQQQRTEEAERRRKVLLQHEQQQKQKNRRIGSNNTLRRYRPQMIGDDDTPPLSSTMAIGHPLLLSIGENYIRSTYAVDLLRPYATWTVSSSKDTDGNVVGPLFPIASQSLSQIIIPAGQASCDWAARENLLWLLQDQEWRDFAKSITTRYINVDEAND